MQQTAQQKQLFDLFDAMPVRVDKQTIAKHIDELVGVFCDPLIMPRSAWADTLPSWVRDQVTLQRLIHLIKCNRENAPIDSATDAEAMAYIYPLTMDSPLDHYWTEIYLYVCGKCCEAIGREVPEDIKIAELDDYRQMFLDNLKRWIYRKRKEARPKKPRPQKRDLRIVKIDERYNGIQQQIF